MESIKGKFNIATYILSAIFCPYYVGHSQTILVDDKVNNFIYKYIDCLLLLLYVLLKYFNCPNSFVIVLDCDSCFNSYIKY